MVERLYGTLAMQGGFSVADERKSMEPLEGCRDFDARSKEEVDAAFQKIFHYGKYSADSFRSRCQTFTKRLTEQREGNNQRAS